MGDVARLEALVGQIREELGKVGEGSRNVTEHALEAGRLLLEAKKQVAHGQWRSWLQQNFQLSERTAQQYMRLSRSNPQRVADFSIRAAIKATCKTGRSGHAARPGEAELAAIRFLPRVPEPGLYGLITSQIRRVEKVVGSDEVEYLVEKLREAEREGGDVTKDRERLESAYRVAGQRLITAADRIAVVS